MMKKWMGGLLALTLLAGVCAGCGEKKGEADPVDDYVPSGIYYDITGIDPRETMLEVDGNQVPAELYFYWLTYTCGTMENNLSMYHTYYGLYNELFNEDGTLNWSADFEEGTTLSQQATADAEHNIKFYAAIENLAAQRGITLTEEDQADLDSSVAAAEEQLGSGEFDNWLELMGITRESYRKIASVSKLFDHLLDLVLDEGDELYRDLGSSIYVDHILLSTVNSETGEALSEEEIAAKRATAEDLLSQLQAADNLEGLFTQLASEYGEDPGRETEQGYLMDENTNFVQAFKDAALALEVGELSGIVETDYGYHILLRKDLTEEQRRSLASDQLSAILEEKVTAAEVVRSEKLDAIEAAGFYADYNQAAQAIVAAREAADNIAGGDEADGSAPDTAAPDDTAPDTAAPSDDAASDDTSGAG